MARRWTKEQKAKLSAAMTESHAARKRGPGRPARASAATESLEASNLKLVRLAAQLIRSLPDAKLIEMVQK